MENNQNTNTVNPGVQESDFDILYWAKKLWNGKKTIIIWLAVFTVIGFAAALLKPKRYQVEAVIVPVSSSSTKTSSLSSLAALAGFSLDISAGSELSPLVYPKITNSIPFKMELLKTPLHYDEFDEPVAMLDYKEKHVPTFWENFAKYTFGLPGVIMKAIRPEKEDSIVNMVSDGETPKYCVISKEEARMCKNMDKSVSLNVDKKEGYLTLTVIGPEPLAATELGQHAVDLLQQEIIRFKVEKSQAQLDFIQGRYDEVKAETEELQAKVARFTDKSNGLVNSYSQLEMMRIQNKYTISNSVYQELAKQLEQAKLQVKADTPTFSVVKPIVMPTEDMDSGLKTLIGYMFFGFIIGCGIIIGKDYIKVFKEKWQNAGEEKQGEEKQGEEKLG